jgi:hypothetical protein
VAIAEPTTEASEHQSARITHADGWMGAVLRLTALICQP